MKSYKIINFKKFKNVSGKLLPITFDKKFPIKVKRIFFIYGKKNKLRGDHAHKKCSQLFIPIAGKVLLEIKTIKIKKKIILNNSSKFGILVPPGYWCKVKFFNNNSILMVGCDKYYDPKDYINNFKTYKKLFKQKWKF